MIGPLSNISTKYLGPIASQQATICARLLFYFKKIYSLKSYFKTYERMKKISKYLLTLIREVLWAPKSVPSPSVSRFSSKLLVPLWRPSNFLSLIPPLRWDMVASRQSKKRPLSWDLLRSTLRSKFKRPSPCLLCGVCSSEVKIHSHTFEPMQLLGQHTVKPGIGNKPPLNEIMALGRS